MAGRNDPCPCGSGKKYKKCCMNTNTALNMIQNIENTLLDNQCSTSTIETIANLFRYMKEHQWVGACHATSSVLFVALSELGFEPVLCYGEVVCGNAFVFDHSWVEINNSVFDLACYMTLQNGLPVSNPVLFGNDIVTRTPPTLKYGISGRGLDMEARLVASMPFCDYMDGFPEEKQGLWGVLAKIIADNNIDIDALRKKYANVERVYRH